MISMAEIFLFADGDEGLLNGSCVNRAESKNLTSKSQSLFLENFFPTIPSIPETCSVNSDRLSNMLNVCYEKAGKRWANFLAVNFYKVGAPISPNN